MEDELAQQAADEKLPVKSLDEKISYLNKSSPPKVDTITPATPRKNGNRTCQARKNIDRALKILSIEADGYEEHEQQKLADAVAYLEQADRILEKLDKRATRH